jgi:hypothetical protein
MLTHLPLDDELNQLFYFEDGIWRLVWANALGRCVLRRERARVDFAEAVLMIARGNLLWARADEALPRLEDGTPPDVVRREQLLLGAFLRSPAGRRIARWSMRRSLELWIRDARSWLETHELAPGDADATGEG